MQVGIEIESWHQAHHLAGVLTDAEWHFNDAAAKQIERYGNDEVAQALTAYAKFFRYLAKEVTKQARALNASGMVARSDAINS